LFNDVYGNLEHRLNEFIGRQYVINSNVQSIQTLRELAQQIDVGFNPHEFVVINGEDIHESDDELDEEFDQNGGQEVFEEEVIEDNEN